MSSRETELKFMLSSDALAKLAQHPAFEKPGATSLLKSVYFDTGSRTLRRAGFGLRVRSGKGRFVQTLKGQGLHGPVGRTEWETEVDGENLDRAALARTPASGFLERSDRLAPVFTTEIERTTRLWVDGLNVVEVSIDDGEIVAAGKRERVRELELELKTGEPGALFTLADTIVRTFPARLSFSSKAERGYRLAAGQKPQPQKALALQGAIGGSTADSFRVIAWSSLDQIAANGELLAAHRSTEALHQMRVGLRRFRAALAVFGEMLSDQEYMNAKRETKWLAGQLDRARNLDVFIQDTFRPAFVVDKHRSAYAELGADLLKAQSAAYSQAVAAIESQRYAEFLVKTAAWLEVGEWSTTTDPVISNLRRRPAIDFAGEQLDRLRRKVVRGTRKVQKLEPAARHKLRIKAKKLRYAAEFFWEAFEISKKKPRRFTQALGILQDNLGNLQDIVVARDLAADLVRDKSAQVGLAAGLMVGARESGARYRAANRALRQLCRSPAYWR